MRMSAIRQCPSGGAEGRPLGRGRGVQLELVLDGLDDLLLEPLDQLVALLPVQTPGGVVDVEEVVVAEPRLGDVPTVAERDRDLGAVGAVLEEVAERNLQLQISRDVGDLDDGYFHVAHSG